MKCSRCRVGYDCPTVTAQKSTRRYFGGLAVAARQERDDEQLRLAQLRLGVLNEAIRAHYVGTAEDAAAEDGRLF